jgi:hypothetical protein
MNLNNIATDFNSKTIEQNFIALSTAPTGLVPQDIRKINKSLEEADKGMLISFSPPPSGSVPPQDIYKYDFDVAYRLPLNPLSKVVFTPSLPNNPEKASYLSSSINANINIGISIKSIHKAETQTLIRLRVKTIYNTTLYTDYILVVASPQKELQIKGSILSRVGNSSESIGINGGRILRLDSTTSPDTASQLFRGMIVSGPGIPENSTVTIRSFGVDNRSDIELLPYFDVPGETSGSSRAQGTYTFTLVSSCLSAEDLEQIKFNNQFIVLDSTNNWSFSFQDRSVVKFVPHSGLNANDVSILLNIKNFDALLGPNSASSIPSISYLYGKGRVFNDTICIKSL